MTPSLPTFLIASAIMPPMALSLLAETVATCATISPSSVTGLESRFTSATAASTALSTPRFRAMGFAPAATFFTPSRKIACARMVAVVVPSPATSLVLEATSRTICAPMFSSGSFNSISLATVTPSLVMFGPPNFFSRTTLRPLGPSVTLTASASWLTPRKIAWREFSEYTICFAIQFDIAAGVLPEQNAIANLNVERNHLAVFEAFAFSDRHHFALLGLFLGRIGNVQTTLHCLLLLNPFDHDAVVKRTNLHRLT